MATNGKTDSQLWTALGALDDDLFDPALADEAVDGELRALGVDPGSLEKRATAFLEQAQEEERLAWQGRARARLAELQRRASGSTAVVQKEMSRQAILARLEELRTATPALGSAIRVAARKRRPEESSDEELRTLLAEMEALREIEKG